jgi:HMG (high mobility group) box
VLVAKTGFATNTLTIVPSFDSILFYQGMPKRPLSAYNLYFRSERQALLGEDLTQREYGVADPTKRKHRKTHGKISFQDMAQIISEKWKNIPKEDRLPFERQAGEEKRRYREALDLWKAQQRQVADDDIVRKVSLEKSASEELHAATAAAAAATSGEDDSDDATHDERGSDDQNSGDGGSSESDVGNDKRRADADGSDSDGDTNVDAGEAGPRPTGKRGKRRKTAGMKPGGAAAVAQGSTSPRSETAALLIAMPSTRSTSGIAAPDTGSGGFASAPVASLVPGGMMALSNPLGTPRLGLSGIYAPADATERVVRDSALLLGFPHLYGVPTHYLPSMQPLTAAYHHARVDVSAAAPTTAASRGDSGGHQSMHERYRCE